NNEEAGYYNRNSTKPVSQPRSNGEFNVTHHEKLEGPSFAQVVQSDREPNKNNLFHFRQRRK
ncbi:hypothetical protein L195_g048969, partial [Trifolium pratense]